MVSRIVKFLEREVSGLHEAAYLLAFFTVLSNVAAFVRDRLFAHYYGASATLDVYYAAFRLPDFIFFSVLNHDRRVYGGIFLGADYFIGRFPKHISRTIRIGFFELNPYHDYLANLARFF